MKVGISYPDSGFNKWIPGIKSISAGVLEEFDLIIFPGGSDISPKLYGEPNKYSSVNLARDEREISIYNAYYPTNTKFLGICRGHQFLNAMGGGKLVQDLHLDMGIVHGGWHPIQKINNGKVPPLFEMIVNSTHHQGVVIPANGQKVTSTHKNIIESTESDKIITLQWHPEYYESTRKSAIDFFQYILEWAS